MRDQQKQANTLTGVGGARLRVQPNANNQDVILKDLMTLQASIEELMGEYLFFNHSGLTICITNPSHLIGLKLVNCHIIKVKIIELRSALKK